MKHYRIIYRTIPWREEYDGWKSGWYEVQERILWFFWFTIEHSGFYPRNKFNSKESAQQFINNLNL